MPARVLVVDDNVDAANTLAMVLDTLGLERRVENDGASALRAADEFMPHGHCFFWQPDVL